MTQATTRSMVVSVMMLVGIAACGQAPTSRSPVGSASDPGLVAAPTRTLTLATRNEPASIAGKPLKQSSVGLYTLKATFGAGLAVLDDRGLPQPRLATALPQLNTDSWRLFPDGKMETTWKLKPNLVWHDGTALSAEDYVFAWNVYRTPELGVAGFPPLPQIEEVLAPDRDTIVIRWTRPYPQADGLAPGDFDPLPRHVLESLYTQENWEGIVNHPYWNREYIGLGPFRLTTWEPGAYIEGEAFDRYVLGRPKIARLRITWIADVNAAVANVLAGEVQVLPEGILEYEQSMTLKQAWASNHGGSTMFHPNQYKATRFELRPELANPKTLLDVRVRRALALTMDKAAMNELLYDGQALVAESAIPPMLYHAGIVEAATTKYPYDPRRSEQLMTDVGYARGPDGTWVHPVEGRFSAELKTHPGPGNEREVATIASTWRDSGFDVQEAMLGVAQAQDQQLRATFPGMYHNSQTIGEPALYDAVTTAIPSVETRWVGGNRGGWSNPEYDRLANILSATLDRQERGQLIAQMMRIYTEDPPVISVFFSFHYWAWTSAVTGPQLVAPGSSVAWNIHEWEYR